MKVLKKYRICPNCGHTVFGSRCMWCNSILVDEKNASQEEKQPRTSDDFKPPEQKVVEIIAEDRPEAPGTITMLEPVAAEQQEWQDTDSVEQMACELIEKVKEDAETKSAEIIVKAQEKADKILDNAEKASMELADITIAEADEKSKAIINDSQQKAERILSEGKKIATELVYESNLEAEAKSNEIIEKANQKAEQIIQEAQQIASATVQKVEKSNDKISGRDLIISSIIILAGIIIVVLAYLYVRFHM